MRVSKTFVVYMATNIANGKRYIGYTSVGLQRRRAAHLGKAYRQEPGCPKFHNAIRKYGREAFAWKVVATFGSRLMAMAEEIRLIKKLNPEYNLTIGGEGNGGGTPWNRKPVTCLDDGNIFPSATSAAEFYGLTAANVHEVCQGKYRSARAKYHFVFGNVRTRRGLRLRMIRKIENDHANNRRKVAKRKQPYRGVIAHKDVIGRSAAGPQKQSKSVRCLSDGRIFPSASAAARHYDLNASSVSQLCSGSMFIVGKCMTRRLSAGGHVFEYVRSDP